MSKKSCNKKSISKVYSYLNIPYYTNDDNQKCDVIEQIFSKKKSKSELVYDCIFISNFLNTDSKPWMSTGKKMSDDDIIDYHCTNFINALAKTKGKKLREILQFLNINHLDKISKCNVIINIVKLYLNLKNFPDYAPIKISEEKYKNLIIRRIKYLIYKHKITFIPKILGKDITLEQIIQSKPTDLSKSDKKLLDELLLVKFCHCLVKKKYSSKIMKEIDPKIKVDTKICGKSVYEGRGFKNIEKEFVKPTKCKFMDWYE